MENKKINISFYGGKSLFSKKESPLIAEIISCDKCEQCSFFKEGKCLKITSPFSGYCKYGIKERIQGYTSRAARYYDFRKKYEKDPAFDKLDSVSNDRYIAEIGKELYIYLPCTAFDKVNKKITDPALTKCQFFIDKQDFTNEFIYEICTFKPHYVFEYKIIEKYQDKIVPEFLYQLQKYLPDIYNCFIKEYSEFKEIAPNHTGKNAYIHTLNKNCDIEIDKNIFKFDGEFLFCDNYKSYWLLNNTPAEVKIKVTEGMTCKITDNSQVNENTIFV